jgi:putative Mg2+ transporter-C (MgtC) family protein
MDGVLSDLAASFQDAQQFWRAITRMVAALIVGALLGYQRERSGKAAGLRTHMLIAFGTSLFLIAMIELGMQSDALSRVIQGIATGIGFLGAGVIMKIDERQEIRGLTTSAGVWATAACSVAIGLGRIGLGLAAGLIAWVVLGLFQKFEARMTERPADRS